MADPNEQALAAANSSLSIGAGKYKLSATGSATIVGVLILLSIGMFAIMYQQHQDLYDGIRGLIYVNTLSPSERQALSQRMAKPHVIQKMMQRDYHPAEE